MKKTLLLLLMTLLLSCNNNKDNFYIGTWELNKDNNISTLTIFNSDTLNWDWNGYRVFDKLDFNAIKLSDNQYNLVGGAKDSSIKITFQRLSDNQCIAYNYKRWINENMVDEVFLARKNKIPRIPIKIPNRETIILPLNYKGEFFIIYLNSAKNDKQVVIDKDGIGINHGKPDFKQLFNSNRIFKFEDDNSVIPIANPNDYTNKQIDSSLLNDAKAVIIQEGFNQSGRDYWNKEQNKNISNDLNIEYFSIRWIIK